MRLRHIGVQRIIASRNIRKSTLRIGHVNRLYDSTIADDTHPHAVCVYECNRFNAVSVGERPEKFSAKLRPRQNAFLFIQALLRGTKAPDSVSVVL